MKSEILTEYSNQVILFVFVKFDIHLVFLVKSYLYVWNTRKTRLCHQFARDKRFCLNVWVVEHTKMGESMSLKNEMSGNFQSDTVKNLSYL